jgi:hypothetical protein
MLTTGRSGGWLRRVEEWQRMAPGYSKPLYLLALCQIAEHYLETVNVFVV